MNKTLLAATCLLVFFLLFSSVRAQNPFITKPEDQHRAPAPAIKSKLFVKILIWQHDLRERMSQLVREAEATGSLRPLIFLVLAAFAYGVIHAAGPGHGKAIALSYILSHRPTLFQGMLFSNSLALFHGASGILFVLMIRVVLNQSIVKNLESVTHITQIVSFSLVFCLGLWIFIRSLMKLRKHKHGESRGLGHHRQPKQYAGPVLSALVVGSIPCPGVVMVMLFALSLDLFLLGILLGVTISAGMALTITIVVIMAMSGKVASLSAASKHGNLAAFLEHSIEIVAGLALATLGLLFLGANL